MQGLVHKLPLGGRQRARWRLLVVASRRGIRPPQLPAATPVTLAICLRLCVFRARLVCQEPPLVTVARGPPALGGALGLLNFIMTWSSLAG